MTHFVFHMKAVFGGALLLQEEYKRDMASQIIGNSNYLVYSLFTLTKKKHTPKLYIIGALRVESTNHRIPLTTCH